MIHFLNFFFILGGVGTRDLVNTPLDGATGWAECQQCFFIYSRASLYQQRLVIPICPPPLDPALVIVHLHIYIMTHVVQLRNVVVIHPIRSPFVSEIIQKTNGRRVQSRIYE